MALHKVKLPFAMKSIGDSYVRKEFRTHMVCLNVSESYIVSSIVERVAMFSLSSFCQPGGHMLR